MRTESLKKDALRGVDLYLGLGGREEVRPIDLWKRLPLSRMRRPLEFEYVARLRDGYVRIRLDRPGVDRFATFLLRRAQIDEVP